MKRRLRYLPLVLLGCGLLPLSAKACDCLYAGAPCKAFANTPTIFAGRVVKISRVQPGTASAHGYEDRLVFFEVERSYRGWDAKSAEVLADWNNDCGYRFQEGVRYLVYAYPHSSTGKLATSICTRTQPMSEASEDLEYLGTKGDSNLGAGIEGSIEEESRDSLARTDVIGFMAGIKVKVESGTGRWTAVSQKDGRFQLWGLLPGTYRVNPVLPRSLWPTEQTVDLKRNSCADLRFLATPRPPRSSSSSRSDENWHQVFQGRLAKVEVERTLYGRGKDEDCFMAVRVTNLANRPIGVDLRKFWNVVYPNSWGFSKTPTLGVVEEIRNIREPMSALDKKKLLLDYLENRLTTLLPRRSITYFRKFTVGHNIRKQIDSGTDTYLIVGLDGALQLTDGQTTEEIVFPPNDGVAEARRCVVIRLPVHWETVSQNSLVVEERP